MAGPCDQRHSQGEQDHDDQPLGRAIAAVRIHPGHDLDPVMPEEGDNGNQAGDRAEYRFQPESVPKTLPHNPSLSRIRSGVHPRELAVKACPGGARQALDIGGGCRILDRRQAEGRAGDDD